MGKERKGEQVRTTGEASVREGLGPDRLEGRIDEVVVACVRSQLLFEKRARD